MPHSLAFKCIYNDGGQGFFVGFKDVCSLDTMRQNVQCREIYCGSESCPCHTHYFQNRMQGERPAFPCAESRLFRDWEFGTEAELDLGNTSAEALAEAAPEQFAILTTRFPGDLESERKIVGLFQIAEIIKRGGETIVVAASAGRIRLPLEEARHLFFWAYCPGECHRPDWDTGLFRYLDDGQVHRILADIAETVRDEITRARIDDLIRTRFGSGPAPRAAGCMREKSVSRKADIAQARKYGLGGEGEDHRRMKEWLRDHPEEIGITQVVRVAAEHAFPSGDCADLLFKRGDGGFSVVEIETIAPLPAAHRVIKHRALLCAEQGLELYDPDVDAILVAWSFPPDVEAFCRRYGIITRQLRLKGTSIPQSS